MEVEILIQIASVLIVILPLLASVITGLVNKRFTRKKAHRLTTASVAASFFLSCFVAFLLYFNEESRQFNFNLYTWGRSEDLHFDIGFLIDSLSSLMMVVVSFVSWMVHIYTIGYMKDDPGYRRFFSYIALFTFGMLMLVMSNNFLQLFFGWEMVGLMSYLLIGFWYQKESALMASLKAFLVNRVGDMGFVIGIAAVFYYFDSLDYQTVFTTVQSLSQESLVLFRGKGIEISALTLMCFALFVGAMGKSAQIPLHVWLPDSMEGPTPISALIHAATMVTAGVFMVARLSPLFEYSDAVLNFILLIGALTALLMGLLGLVQEDIKRIIAYSTLSQLGYMMTAMGASAYSIGIFHLVTHAFFKALLFLAAGSVIIALHHEQNIWKMGNLKKYLPITYVTLLIGSLALIGFPFFSGFYSKDLIIEAVKQSNLPGSTFAYYCVLGSVLITALYTFRLLFVVFHSKERFELNKKSHLKEASWVVWLPLVVLAIPSMVAGFFAVPFVFENYFGDSLQVHTNHPSMDMLTTEFTSAVSMGLHGFLKMPFWLALLGIFIAWFCYSAFPFIPEQIQKRFNTIYYVLKQKYGFDNFYRWVVARGARVLGVTFWRFGDQWLIDGMAVNGSADTVGRLSKILRKVQTGYLYHYAFFMITGFLLLLVWLILK